MATDAAYSSNQTEASTASQGETARAIQKKLKQTRLRVKLTDLISGLILFATFSLLYLLTLSVIDHWLFGLGFWTRLLSLFVFLGAGSYFVWHQIMPLFMHSINPVYVAKMIEQSQPSLKNSLINFLLLRKENSKVHQAVMSVVEEKAAADLKQIPLDTAVDYSKSIYLGYVLAGVAVLFGLYAILSPKNPLPTIYRVAMPWADIARPSRVEIVDVTPGDSIIYQGETVEVRAKIYDMGDEPVMLYYSTLARQLVDQPIVLTPDAAGTSYRGTISPDDLGIQQELSYRIEAGDAVTREYRIEVREAPAIEIQSIVYKFPLYTGEPTETQEREGAIRAVEGTQVFITAKTNGPINNVYLQFDPDGKRESLLARRLTFKVTEDQPQQAKASFFLKLKEDQKTPKYRSYSLRYENQEGVLNPNPVRYSIDVLPDLSPEIEILSPEPIESEVALDGRLEFELRAIDPDYALSQITIHGVTGETNFIEHDLLKSNQTGQQLHRWNFQPAKHKLKQGQTVHIWAAAEDNKTDSKNFATPNQSRTQRYTVRILPPVNRPENNPENNPDSNPEKDPDKEQQNEPNEGTNDTEQNGNKPDNKRPMPKDNQQDNQENPENKDPNQKQEPGKEEEPGKPNQENQQQPEQGKEEQQGNQDEQQKENSTQGTEPGDNQEQQNNKPEEGDNPENSGSQSEDPGNEPQQGTPQEGGGTGKEKMNESSEKSESGQGDNSDGNSKPSNGSNPGSNSGAGDMNNNQAADPNNTEPPNKNGGDSAENSGEGSRGDPTGEQQFSEEPVSADGSQDGDAFDRIQKYLEEKKKQQQESGSQGKPEEDQLTDSATAKKEHSESTEDNMGETSEENNMGNSTGAKENEGAGGTGEASNNKPNNDEQQGTGQSQDRQAEDEGGDPMKGGRVPDDQDPSQAKEEPKSGDQGTADNTNSGAGKPSAEDSTGSPPSIDDKANRQEKNDTRPDGNEKQEEGDMPKSPSNSEKQSDSEGDQSGDQSGGGGPGGGQSAKQEGNDSAGSTSAADEGKGKAEQTGMGETGKEKGTQDKSDAKTGSSGTEKGNGSSTQSGDSDAGKGSESKDQQPKEPSKEQSDAKGSGTGGMNDDPQGGGEPGTFADGSKPSGPDAVGDKANLEYTRKATDMVLKELKNQKNPDQEMLDDLGWTKEELQQFTNRWNQMKNEAASNQTGDPAKQELDEALRSLGLSGGKDKLRSANNRPATAGGASDTSRSRPPAAFLEQYKAYLKGASQRSR